MAHRLNTIADYDTVIVMKRGRIAEIGGPYELIRLKGLFSEMVKHTGNSYTLITNKAKEKYEKDAKKIA